MTPERIFIGILILAGAVVFYSQSIGFPSKEVQKPEAAVYMASVQDSFRKCAHNGGMKKILVGSGLTVECNNGAVFKFAAPEPKK